MDQSEVGPRGGQSIAWLRQVRPPLLAPLARPTANQSQQRNHCLNIPAGRTQVHPHAPSAPCGEYGLEEQLLHKPIQERICHWRPTEGQMAGATPSPSCRSGAARAKARKTICTRLLARSSRVACVRRASRAARFVARLPRSAPLQKSSRTSATDRKCPPCPRGRARGARGAFLFRSVAAARPDFSCANNPTPPPRPKAGSEEAASRGMPFNPASNSNP